MTAINLKVSKLLEMFKSLKSDAVPRAPRPSSENVETENDSSQEQEEEIVIEPEPDDDFKKQKKPKKTFFKTKKTEDIDDDDEKPKKKTKERSESTSSVNVQGMFDYFNSTQSIIDLQSLLCSMSLFVAVLVLRNYWALVTIFYYYPT